MVIHGMTKSASSFHPTRLILLCNYLSLINDQQQLIPYEIHRFKLQCIFHHHVIPYREDFKKLSFPLIFLTTDLRIFFLACLKGNDRSMTDENVNMPS